MKDRLEEIKKIAQEFFQHLGWEPVVEVEISEKMIFLKINVDEPSLLIGKGGANLDSIQHLLRLMINRRLDEFIRLMVDVADYKSKKGLYLEQEALERALEVKNTGKSQVLGPMNSYERRIIHLALQKMAGVDSESTGEGPERRIVIKPEK